MTNIKKFKSFLENYNQDFFSPEEPITITDREEIVKIMGKLSELQVPTFDRNPNYKNKQGELMRIISQSEFDRFVEYNMKDPILCYDKPRQVIPSGLDFLGRKKSERKGFFDMTSIWIDKNPFGEDTNFNDWFKYFKLGRIRISKGGVWFAHENILKGTDFN